MKSSEHLFSFLFFIIYFLSLMQSQERINQKQPPYKILGAIQKKCEEFCRRESKHCTIFKVSSLSAIFFRPLLHSLIYVPGSLPVRAITTSQIAVINTFKSSETQGENIEELDVVRLFCSLSKLNKVGRENIYFAIYLFPPFSSFLSSFSFSLLLHLM